MTVEIKKFLVISEFDSVSRLFEAELSTSAALALEVEATTLTGMHFGTTILTVFLRWMGYIQTSHLPSSELLRFVLFANFSIVGMNVSLMWSSVGFYQVRYSRCECQYQRFYSCLHSSLEHSHAAYVYYLQRKYALGSFNLLGLKKLMPITTVSHLWFAPGRLFRTLAFFHLQCLLEILFNKLHQPLLGVSQFLHSTIMQHCGWDQSQPIHLRRRVYGCVIPSAWPYEDYSGSDIRIHLFRERWSQVACDFGYGHCNCGNDLVS
ncbi:hypothetical protein LWI29_012723 [Acer saccharum]|uniref:Uncharacterized protein n=1 Tax=Acer saccharum TaxID=4024 RepID=A0AA39VZG9_ACESA|nr:hypothetical protein LWI29_012723 [Acer saccharum]